MRRNIPRRIRRNPEEHYDVIYNAFPDRPGMSRIIDHPRKLVTINLCADPWTAQPEEILYERTIYEDEVML